MKTTIALDQKVATRVALHAEMVGNKSMKAIAEFMLRKSCDFIDTKGYDEFIKISAGKK